MWRSTECQNVATDIRSDLSSTFFRMQLPQTNGKPWYQCMKYRAVSFHEKPSANSWLFKTCHVVPAHCRVRHFITCLTSIMPSGENSTCAKQNRKMMFYPRQYDPLFVCGLSLVYSTSLHGVIVPSGYSFGL